MRDFDEIWARAAERKGGDAALEALANEYPPKTPTQLAAISDDRWLAEMTRGVFRAGFNWQVIDNKWPGFEAAFLASIRRSMRPCPRTSSMRT
jgi:3-methyladenine DNA glycosylase Tag